MDINEAYILIQTIFNKTQNGNITPTQFNNAAPICQMSVINELLGNEQEYSPGHPIPRYGYGLDQKIIEILRPLTNSLTNQPIVSGSVPYPDGSLYIDSITENATGKIIYPAQYDESHIVQSSLIRPPVSGHGVYTIYGSVISIYPSSINSVNIQFILTPDDPIWNFTITSGVPVYNSSGSHDFELSPLAHLRIVAKILQFFGINLGLSDVTRYALQLEQSGA